MRHPQLKSKVGIWVEGRDFYNREQEIDDLLRCLRDGNHVSLAAQRRTGKTSLLREAARQLEKEMICIYVDLEAAADEADAITEIALQSHQHQSLQNRVRSLFGNVTAGVEEFGVDALKVRLQAAVAADWRAKGDRILTDLGAQPVVLMLDEFPILLVKLIERDPEAARTFLGWLRRSCLAGSQLRVVVTGSIGLAPIASRAGMSGLLNHYSTFQLQPWPPSTAMDCLGALAANYGITLDQTCREEVVELLGCCIPFHVQLLFQLLEREARRTKQLAPRVDDVRRVHQKLLGSHGSADLAHMEERLRQAIEPSLQPLTLDLLTEAAVTGALTHAAALLLATDHGVPSPDQALRDVLAVLEHDGYLQAVQGRWQFVSRLLREWWKGRHSMFYTPVGGR